jgi:hypothetical protein
MKTAKWDRVMPEKLRIQDLCSQINYVDNVETTLPLAHRRRGKQSRTVGIRNIEI